MSKISQILRKCYNKISLMVQRNKAKREAKNIAKNFNSYFSEKERKSLKQINKDNVRWAKQYNEANCFYFLYGLDVVGSDESNYIDYLSFMKSRNKANKLGDSNSQVVLLRDKFLFHNYMKSFNFSTPDVFAFCIFDTFYDSNMVEIPFELFANEKDYFVKEINGECASFVKHIRDFEQLKSIKDKLQQGAGYIFQRRIEQCSKMNDLNPCSINTLRVVTVNKNGHVYVLSSLLRVGTAKTGNVDNWAAGGLVIGIEENGQLKKYGFFKPAYGLKWEYHPDTRMVFSEFKVPMYKEALEAACEAHKLFYGVRSIGWDIAISNNGPIFIEGNDNWEISLHQACDRPLKKEWLATT